MGDREIVGSAVGIGAVGDRVGGVVGTRVGRVVGHDVGCFVGELVRLYFSQMNFIVTLPHGVSSQSPP